MPPEDVCGISRNFSRLSPCEGQVAYALLTRAPVADRSVATPSLPLDLHVLSLSLAFILSQDQTLRCLSCSFIFLCHSDSQTNNLGSSRHLRSFFLLTEGFRPLPSSCLFIASFQCSLRRFLFRKAVTKVLPLFLTAKFFANFFSSFFFRTPRPRRSDALRHHAKASRPPVCFALRLQRYCLLPFPPNFSASFFTPFFNFFHNTLILRHLFQKLFSPRFPSFATETIFHKTDGV